MNAVLEIDWLWLSKKKLSKQSFWSLWKLFILESNNAVSLCKSEFVFSYKTSANSLKEAVDTGLNYIYGTEK